MHGWLRQPTLLNRHLTLLKTFMSYLLGPKPACDSLFISPHKDIRVQKACSSKTLKVAKHVSTELAWIQMSMAGDVPLAMKAFCPSPRTNRYNPVWSPVLIHFAGPLDARCPDTWISGAASSSVLGYSPARQDQTQHGPPQMSYAGGCTFTYATFLSQARAGRQIALPVPFSKQLRRHRTQIQSLRHHTDVSSTQRGWTVWEMSSLPAHSQQPRCWHWCRPIVALSLDHYHPSPMTLEYRLDELLLMKKTTQRDW